MGRQVVGGVMGRYWQALWLSLAVVLSYPVPLNPYPGFAWAEEVANDSYKHTVYLTNGNEMVGVVEEERDGAVWLRVPGGRLRISRDRIDHVDMTTPEAKEKLVAADQAARQSRTGKDRTKDGEESSESTSAGGPVISTKTPLDTLDHPTGWWAGVRDKFSAFVDRLISRGGQASSDQTVAAKQKKGKGH